MLSGEIHSQSPHKIMFTQGQQVLLTNGKTYFKGTCQSLQMCQCKSLHLWVLRYDSNCARKLWSWKAGKNVSAVLAKANISEWGLLDYCETGAWLPLLQGNGNLSKSPEELNEVFSSLWGEKSDVEKQPLLLE